METQTTPGYTTGLVLGNVLALSVFTVWMSIILQGLHASALDYVKTGFIIILLYGLVVVARRELEWL